VEGASSGGDQREKDLKENDGGWCRLDQIDERNGGKYLQVQEREIQFNSGTWASFVPFPVLKVFFPAYFNLGLFHFIGSHSSTKGTEAMQDRTPEFCRVYPNFLLSVSVCRWIGMMTKKD